MTTIILRFNNQRRRAEKNYMAAPLTTQRYSTINATHQSKSGQHGPSEARLPHCAYAFSAEAMYLPIMKTKPKWKAWTKILEGLKSHRKSNKNAMDIYTSLMKLN